MGTRLVFTRAEECAELRRVVPEGYDVEFKARAHYALGPAAYVALSEEDLEAYEPWFRGLGVRVRGCLRHEPLPAGGALYLPVTHDSWAVLADGPGGLGAALAAGRAVLGVRGAYTVVVPAFDPALAPEAAASCRATYRRWRDRVLREADA